MTSRTRTAPGTKTVAPRRKNRAEKHLPRSASAPSPPRYWYAPGYVSGYSGCCHCQASCGNVTADCADSYYDGPCPTPAPPPEPTNACGVSAGSCYDSTTHVVSCDVTDEDCSGYWYSPGYISGYSGCCHCQASCGNVTSDCADSYYDDPCPTPAPAESERVVLSLVHALRSSQSSKRVALVVSSLVLDDERKLSDAELHVEWGGASFERGHVTLGASHYHATNGTDDDDAANEWPELSAGVTVDWTDPAGTLIGAIVAPENGGRLNGGTERRVPAWATPPQSAYRNRPLTHTPRSTRLPHQESRTAAAAVHLPRPAVRGILGRGLSPLRTSRKRGAGCPVPGGGAGHRQVLCASSHNSAASDTHAGQLAGCVRSTQQR